MADEAEGDKKIRFEKAKFAEELALKREELDLKKAEADRQSRFWSRVSPVAIALFAGFVGLIGNVAVTFIQGRNSADIESRKSQAAMIAEAIKTGDEARAKRNVLFFLDTGLIADPDGKIRTALQQPGGTPVLPPASTRGPEFLPARLLDSSSPLAKHRQAVGRLDVLLDSAAISCTALALSSRLILTASHCISKAGQALFWPPLFDTTKQHESQGVRIKLPPVYISDGAGIALISTETDVAVATDAVLLRAPRDEEAIYILQYLGGAELQVSYQNCRVQLGQTEPVSGKFAYLCATAPGSGGAPVFAAEDGALLGIHLFRSTVLGVDPTAYGGGALLLVGASLASLAAQDSSLKQALGLARVSGP